MQKLYPCNASSAEHFTTTSLTRILSLCLILLYAGAYAQVTFQPRANFGQRLEPNDKVLHGLGQGLTWADPINWSNEYMDVTGSGAYPFYYMEYSGLGNVQDMINTINSKLPEMTKPGQYYAIQLGIYLGDGPVVPSDETFTNFATALKNWNRPVWIRIGYEFNGPWNKYSNYENYKTIFRKVYNALRAVGADNVATVWCADTGYIDEDIMKWWPGVEYVDWFAADIFSVQSITSKQTKDFMALARSYNKPVMIGESTPKNIGVNDGQADWNAWFRPFFDLIRANPEIKAFGYINWNWGIFTQWSDWGDARINTNSTVSTNYRNEVTSSSLYQHAQGETAVRQTLRIGQTPSPGTAGFINLSFNKPATASGECNSSTENAGKAFDGNIYSKWCHNAAGDKWLRVDLGQNSTITRWVVRHAGVSGETAGRNTRDFKLQVSADGTTFSDADAVTGNTANITNRDVAATGRYARLYITNSGEDNAARIYEFEVHGKAGTTTTPNPNPNPGNGTANVALNKPTTTSGACNTNEAGGKAVDGNIYSKWCHNVAGDKWLRVDLGQTHSITRWVVKHAAVGGESATLNTKDFKLQVSSDGTTFSDADAVTGNTANTTDRNVTTSGRYVRLYITNSGGDNAARIYEFEVYGTVAPTSNTNVALNKSTAASGSCNSNEGPEKALDGNIYSKWCHNAAGDKWLRVDLGQTHSISRWVVRHAGVGGENAGRNTRDFKLQVSTDGTTFTDVDGVSGNTANITDRNVSRSGRYFRLYITNSGEDNAARIYEFELYGSAAARLALPQELTTDEIRVSPNPATQSTTLTIEAKQAQTLTVTVTNVQGGQVGQMKRAIHAGKQQVTLPVKGYAKGLYLINVTVDGRRHVKKLVVE